jgi:FtsH-binding integral membrane protein
MFSIDTYRKDAGSTRMSKSAYLRLACLLTLTEVLLVVAGIMASASCRITWTMVVVFLLGMLCFLSALFWSRPALKISAIVTGSCMLGVGIGPVIPIHEATTVHAVLITALTVTVSSTLGIAFPRLFSGWGPYLTISPALGLAVLFAHAVFGVPGVAAMPFVNWAAVVLFTALVAFDLSSASQGPATLENAILVSVFLFLDIFNIFGRILKATDPRQPVQDE